MDTSKKTAVNTKNPVNAKTAKEMNVRAVKAPQPKPVNEKEIESEVERINPDENSMESRG